MLALLNRPPSRVEINSGIIRQACAPTTRNSHEVNISVASSIHTLENQPQAIGRKLHIFNRKREIQTSGIQFEVFIANFHQPGAGWIRPALIKKDSLSIH